jgi:uncharacterized membrane protein YbhN (UPF0104 family)
MLLPCGGAAVGQPAIFVYFNESQAMKKTVVAVLKAVVAFALAGVLIYHVASAGDEQTPRVCGDCSWRYVPGAAADAAASPAPNWADIGDNWQCPSCGAAKAEFGVDRAAALAALRQELRASSPPPLAIAFVLYGVGVFCGAWRWHELMAVQGIKITRWRSYCLTMVGVFFSLALPGAVTGDLIKIAYVTPDNPERKAEAVLTIMIDRLFGIYGLFIAASIAVLTMYRDVLAAEWVVQLGALFVFAGAIGGTTGLLCARFREPLLKLPGMPPLLALGERLLPKGLTAMIGRIVAALDLYREHGRRIVLVIIISLFVHSIIATAVFAIGRGVHEEVLTYRQYFFSTQIANTAGGVPLFPGGLGGRDIVLRRYLVAAGAAEGKAAAVPITYSLVIASWAGVGALFFIATRRRGDDERVPDAAAAEDEAPASE